MTHPCGDPVISSDIRRHEDNCLRCERIAYQQHPYAGRVEAAVTARRRPRSTRTPRRA